MKNFVGVLSLVVGFWVFSPTPEAQAWSGPGSSNSAQRGTSGYRGAKGNNGAKGNKGGNGYKGGNGHKGGKAGKGGKGRSGVPELDPSAAGGAMVLLLGGMAYIASRRREDQFG